MSDERYLVVGLGNPGRQYERTRHNVGWHVIDELARRAGSPRFSSERRALTADVRLAGRRVTLAMPQTYMNLSGESVRALADFYKLPMEHIIIVHDDLDTPLGTIRLRKTGGHGGQNGIRNIIQHLGTKEFARLRFGIGRPPGRMSAKDYVLQGFQGDDAILAQQVVERSGDAVEAWLTDGIDRAMSAYNGDINEPGEDADKPSPDEALQLAERAHELRPDDPKPLQQMVRLYKKTRQLSKAVDAHLALAELYERDDQIRPMLAELEKVLSIRPEMSDLQQMVAQQYEAVGNERFAVGHWLKLAERALADDDIAAARSALDNAVRLNPQHPRAVELQARLKSQ